MCICLINLRKYGMSVLRGKLKGLSSQSNEDKRRRVALLIESSNVYGRELLRGIRSWSRENDSWSFRLVEQGRGAMKPEWLASWEGDGIIARVESEVIQRFLESMRLPIVDVSAALENSGFPQVVTDSAGVVKLAIDYLENLGFRNFAYCGDSAFRWSRLREQEFAYRVKKKGLEPFIRNQRVSRPETEIGRLGNWLEALPKPVAVLACYDVRGQEVMEACGEKRLKVPEEVAVLGVHDDEILCELCDPPMSSVIPDPKRAGYEAAALLKKLMDGETLRNSERKPLLIPPIGISARQSTDVVAIPDEKIARALRYIKGRACQGINVADVLRECPMARTQLERRFRQVIGRSPREEIERVRMGKVQELLSRTTLPISAVAEEAGFEYPEYLSVAFKRCFGVTPKAYRDKTKF
jgi:LacI family transcriptional regulator